MSWDTTLKQKENTHRDAQRQAKRLSILRTSARLFNEHGFYQTSLEQIATSLQVTKPTLYYYVKNKDDILAGILAKALDECRNAIKSAKLLQGSGLEKLTAFAQAYGQVVSDDFGACLILMRTNAPEDKFRAPYHELSAEVFSALQAIIVDGIEDGSINECSPKFMAGALLGALNEAVYWHQVKGRRSPQETADFLMQTLNVHP